MPDTIVPRRPSLFPVSLTENDRLAMVEFFRTRKLAAERDLAHTARELEELAERAGKTQTRHADADHRIRQAAAMLSRLGADGAA